MLFDCCFTAQNPGLVVRAQSFGARVCRALREGRGEHPELGNSGSEFRVFGNQSFGVLGNSDFRFFGRIPVQSFGFQAYRGLREGRGEDAAADTVELPSPGRWVV